MAGDHGVVLVVVVVGEVKVVYVLWSGFGGGVEARESSLVKAKAPSLS